MKDIALDHWEARFGPRFVRALRRMMRLHGEDASTAAAWGVEQAKDHLSEVFDRVRDGECQLVRLHSEDPVVIMSITQLATFVKLATPKRRLADLIAPDPALPRGDALTICEAPIGRDELDIY